ncbi:hypothetical protein K435DRAFT_811113 [Dendrothele bispora CBS 962.96]|uniref:Uncharacterized protein n=1 Tax=Dendrothele bispora (strain CBS 962.96) TaxID=1314807 RepID=A0A4S8KT04_DENBC|nr:hypothetical protein K435DRAFT_811113 [Dendrothele bispora CBS 962.96]
MKNSARKSIQTGKLGPKSGVAQEVTSSQFVEFPPPFSSDFCTHQASSNNNIPNHAFSEAYAIDWDDSNEIIQADGSDVEPFTTFDVQDDDSIFNEAHDMHFIPDERGINKITQNGDGSSLTGFNGAHRMKFQNFSLTVQSVDAQVDADATSTTSGCSNPPAKRTRLRHYHGAHHMIFRGSKLEFNGGGKRRNRLLTGQGKRVQKTPPTHKNIIKMKPTDKQLKDYDDKLKDWEEANQKAIGIIGMKIPTNLSHLQKDTAKSFWETLKTQYGKVGTAALVTKLLDLFRMTFKPGQNPAVTIDSFQNKYIEITSLNDKIAIPEFVLCTLLMHKLGRGWDNFISNIMTNEYTPDKTTGVDEHWTLDHIRNLLSEEYNSRLSRASHNNTYANVARFSGIQTGGTTQSFSSQRAKNTRRGTKRSNSAPAPSGNSNQNKNTSPTSAASSSNSNQNTGNFRGSWRARGNFRGRSRGNYRGRGRGRGNNIVTNMAIMDELEEDTDVDMEFVVNFAAMDENINMEDADAEDNEESSEEEGEQSSNSILQQSTMMILPDDPRRHYQAPPLFVPPLFRVPPSVASDIIPPSELTMPPAHRDSGTFIPPSTQAESSGSSEIIFRPIPVQRPTLPSLPNVIQQIQSSPTEDIHIQHSPDTAPPTYFPEPPRIRSSPDTEIGEINQDLPSLTHAPSTSSEEPPASQHTGALTTNQVPSEIGIGEEIWERPVSPSFHPTSNDQIPRGTVEQLQTLSLRSQQALTTTRYAHTVIWDNVNVLPQFLSSRLRFHYCSFGHIVRYGAPSTCHQGHEIVLITNRYHTKEERPVIHIYYSNLRSVPPAHYEQVLSSRRWYGVRTFGEARFLYNTTRAEWDADRNYEYSRAITDFTNVMPRSSEHPDASLRMQINRTTNMTTRIPKLQNNSIYVPLLITIPILTSAYMKKLQMMTDRFMH